MGKMFFAQMILCPDGVTLVQVFYLGQSFFQNGLGCLTEGDPLMVPGVTRESS